MIAQGLAQLRSDGTRRAGFYSNRFKRKRLGATQLETAGLQQRGPDQRSTSVQKRAAVHAVSLCLQHHIHQPPRHDDDALDRSARCLLLHQLMRQR